MKVEVSANLRIQADVGEKMFKDSEKFQDDIGKALYKSMKRFFKGDINAYLSGLQVVKLVSKES
jgi:hypothetical protein